ncbi:MAG: ABC transporter ATP-binding protein [Nitrosomonas sp.]|nr:ABC transporter ATP-binding protein [Nitrosomonas sp.]MBP6074888.1 ABC transporter ATP-binding protein [Nitrosomonas sp.]
MSEKNKSDNQSSPAVPTIAIIALLVSLFAAQETILKPTRPLMINTERMSTEDVRSRLWQDPFEAVEQHRKQFPSENESNKSSLSVSGTVSQSEGEKSSFTVSGTVTQKMEESAPDECNRPIIHSIEKLRCRIKEEIRINESLHILAVMLPGGPYAEDHEWRLRNRYALISGLYAGNYVPEDSEHIKFINFKDTCKKTLEAENKEKNYFCDFPEYVPYEFFEPIPTTQVSIPKDENKILVLWLNNDKFALSANILETLHQFRKQIQFINTSGIKFDIVGPYNSQTLRKLYGQKEESDKYLENSHIFSPFVTADNDQLNNTKVDRESKSNEWLQNKIIRTTGTHSNLANTLLCELALRGITPYQIKSVETIKGMCSGLKGLKLTAGNQPHHIVLIGELDTFYSQMLTESILKKIDEFSSSENAKISETHVHGFHYLRGLDGITSQRTSTNQDNKNKESQTNKLDNKEAREQAERPTGTSQLDYLLRLAEQIKHLDRIKAKEGGIKAIGITGSDAYDKLLILQALRDKFPNALFFTTDLDARLFHPTEIKSTRNLIVASSYGLQLHHELQRNTPPFRDSYQTALYLTTLLALQKFHPGNQSSKDSLEAIIKHSLDKPRLFEIGNYGAVDLSHTLGNKIHPEPENASASKFPNEEEILGNILEFIYFVLSILTLTLLLYCLLPKNLRPIIVRVCIGAIGLIFFYQAIPALDDHGSESLSFTNGTSIWPANGIRFVAITLAICFFCSVIKQLRKNYLDIARKYKLRKVVKEQEENRGLCSQLLVDEWKTTSNKNRLITDIWSEYLELRRFNHCGKKVGCMLGLFSIFVIPLILAGFSIPEAPFRGVTSYYMSTFFLFLAVATYLILTLVIAEITRLTSRFIKELTSCNIDWPPKTINAYKKYGLPTDAVRNKILMDFIHQQANAINNFIYYPFIILFLLILSRSYFFDNWQISPLLLFIFIFTALITLGSAIRLRKSSEDARKHILDKLDQSLTGNQIRTNDSERSVQIKSLINDIKDLKDGVFQPLSHHPIVLSWLIPFSSIAGVSLFEYFAFSAS